MKAFVSSSRFVLARPVVVARFSPIVAASLLVVSMLMANPAFGQEKQGKVPPVGQPQQFGDDVAEELDPIKKRTAQDEKNTDAKAWFMTGRRKEAAGDDQAAWEAYQKSIEINPNAVEVYRALVPVAFRLNKLREGLQYAEKTVELDPDDINTLRRLGEISFQMQRLPLAKSYFEKAASSKAIDKRSRFYVQLSRDLAVLHGITGDIEKSADYFQVLYDARTDTTKFDLEFAFRRQLDRDQAISFERIGDAMLLAKRYDPAKQAYERLATELKGKPGPHSYSLARVYESMDDTEKAETELQKYFDAKLISKGRAPYELLKKILDKTNRSEDLLPRLEEIRAEDKRNAALLFFLANAYLDNDQPEEAEELYVKTLNGPGAGDPTGFLGLAAVNRKTNKPKELIESLVNAFKTDMKIGSLADELKAIGEDEKVLESILTKGKELMDGQPPSLSPEGSYILGRLAGDVKKVEPSHEFYKFALESKPAAAIAEAVYQEYGGSLMDEDMFEESAKVFEQASEDPRLRGSHPLMLFRMSQALELGGKTEEAVTAITVAKRKAGRPIGLLSYQEGWIYYHAKEWSKAIPIFESVIQDFPNDKETLRSCQFSLSNIYVEQGEKAKGEKILEDVLLEDPNDPSVNNDLGYLYADQGKNLEKAEKMIRIAVEAEPENAAYQDSMGWVLFKREKYEEALPYLEKASSLPTGQDGTIYDHLADCLNKLGRRDDAVKAWKQALENESKGTKPDQELIDQIQSKLDE